MDPWSSWETIANLAPAALNAEQRSLHALGWLRTEINNGGFDQLFFNSAGDVVPDAVAAARAAGATDLADLVTAAMKLLGEPYPIDHSRRRDVVVALREKGGSRLDQLDDRYYHLESTTDLDALMERFAWGA